jgi:glyoxylase-like metal-dependent hydrolase (beta-lactamase superfamily II)
MLFAGDVVFFGGKILLQAIHDCRLDRLIASLRKLRELDVTMLFPGHVAFALSDGQSHIERANQVLDRLLVPEQLVSAW